MDKFSLVRIWQPTPRLGSELAVFSRKFFFTFTVVALAVVSSLTWAQYPYDKLCEPLDDATATPGLYTDVTLLDGTTTDDIDVIDTTDYVSCGQNFRAWSGKLPFPATPRVQSGDSGWFGSVDEETDVTWMSDHQVGILCPFLLLLFVPGNIANSSCLFVHRRPPSRGFTGGSL